MKTRFLLILLLGASVCHAQFGSLVQSTSVTITRSNGLLSALSGSAYAQNGTVRDTTTNGRLTPITVSAVKGAIGMIYGVMIAADTAYASGINMKVLFYRDSTGVGKYIPTDGGVYQTISAIDTSFVAEVPVTLTSYGTTAGGATGSRGYYFQANVPFKLKANDTKLWAVLLADGAITPKKGGKYTIYTWILR